jgi:hypothetical protein
MAQLIRQGSGRLALTSPLLAVSRKSRRIKAPSADGGQSYYVGRQEAMTLVEFVSQASVQVVVKSCWVGLLQTFQTLIEANSLMHLCEEVFIFEHMLTSPPPPQTRGI